MKKINSTIYIKGKRKSLPIHPDDIIAIKMLMIMEGYILGKNVKETAKKYGYSEQRYYQIRRDYLKGGTEALAPRKPGPVKKSKRTDNTINQIIRHKFLDPEASAKVIAQKMKQAGIKISIRSVERTITEKGLQKKTLSIISGKGKQGRGTHNKGKNKTSK